MNKMFILMLLLFPLGILSAWFLFTNDDPLYKYFFWTGFILGALYYLLIAYGMYVSEPLPAQPYLLLIGVPLLMLFFGICLSPIFTVLYFVFRFIGIFFHR
jgi:hypothetical protein